MTVGIDFGHGAMPGAENASLTYNNITKYTGSNYPCGYYYDGRQQKMGDTEALSFYLYDINHQSTGVNFTLLASPSLTTMTSEVASDENHGFGDNERKDGVTWDSGSTTSFIFEMGSSFAGKTCLLEWYTSSCDGVGDSLISLTHGYWSSGTSKRNNRLNQIELNEEKQFSLSKHNSTSIAEKISLVLIADKEGKIALDIKSCSDDNKRAYINAMSLNIIPEPSSTALWMLGLLGLIVYRKRTC